MSASLTQAVADAAASLVATPDPNPTQAVDPTPSPAQSDAGQSGTEGEQAGGDGSSTSDPAAAPPAKPTPKDRRFVHLTKRLQDEADAREAERRRADAAEALLAQLRAQANPDDPAAPRPAPAQPPADVDARARQILQEQEQQRRTRDIVNQGKEQFGEAEWNEKAAAIHGLGATSNPAFMQALMETEHAPKIVAELADDPDALVELLNKTPAAIAARLGKMDAKFAAPTPAPKVSAAPAPAPKVSGTRVDATPDLYNYPADMSMAEYSKMIDKALPGLVGRRA